MSKQLAISAAFSVLAMVAAALLTTPAHTPPATETLHASTTVEAAAPVLDSIVPMLPHTGN